MGNRVAYCDERAKGVLRGIAALLREMEPEDNRVATVSKG